MVINIVYLLQSLQMHLLKCVFGGSDFVTFALSTLKRMSNKYGWGHITDSFGNSRESADDQLIEISCGDHVCLL